MCFSVISRVSFDNITAKWYPEIRHHCPTTPCLLLGTKIDLRDDQHILEHINNIGTTMVSYEEGMICAKKIKAARYMECSALTQRGLKDVFNEAIRTSLFPKPEKKKKKILLRCDLI